MTLGATMKSETKIVIRNLDVRLPTGKVARLRWKEYQFLCLLIEKSPLILTRAEIVSGIWQGTYCSDATINQTIRSIRIKIEDEGHNIIKTIPRIGYKIDNADIFKIEKDSYYDEIDNELDDIDSVLEYKSDPDEGTDNDVVELQKKALQPNSCSKKNRGGDMLGKCMVIIFLLGVVAPTVFFVTNENLPYISNISNKNPQVVLKLTLRDKYKNLPQSLQCFYKNNGITSVTIECMEGKFN
jgi:DNA-binding winged helix-turn-helix (wHTH) protein